MPKVIYKPVEIGDIYDRGRVERVFRRPRANGYTREYAELTCKCGNTYISTTDSLKSGSSRSCGCLLKEVVSDLFKTHGLSYHPAYFTLKHMYERCYDPRQKFYEHYGGRGIGICDEWNPDVVGWDDALKTFIDWADNNGFKKELSIERTNCNKDYSPDNCVFATNHVQCKIKSGSAFRYRISQGLTREEAITKDKSKKGELCPQT